MRTVVLTLDTATRLATQALVRSGTSPSNAAVVARALVLAEAEGLPTHGLVRLLFYTDQAKSGMVDGLAEPTIARTGPAALLCDAATGFAYPAIDLAMAALIPLAQTTGIATAAIANSHHCGVIGHPVQRLAEAGLVGLGFTDASPPAMAAWGGRRRLLGSNPIAIGCPRPGGDPLLVDFSLTTVARGRLRQASARNEPIPPDWALDAEGRPTTDPTAAVSLMPMAGHKGAMLAMMAEILAAALTGANYSFEASSMLEPEGPPPRLGHLFLAISPAVFGFDGFASRVETIVSALLAEGAWLPGADRAAARRRAEDQGITVPADLHEELQRRAGQI